MMMIMFVFLLLAPVFSFGKQWNPFSLELLLTLGRALEESEIMNDGRILLLHILLVSCFAFHSLQWGIFVWDHTIEVIMENKFNSSSIST